MSMEDLIPEEEVVVTITRGGYIKRTRSDDVGQFGFRAATLVGDGDVLEDHL